MKKILDELCGMKGVNSTFLFSAEGELIEFSAPALYDREILSQAAAILARATESISVQHNEWDTIIAHFEDAKLLVLKLENHTLCVVADSNLNLPFLNVSIRVAKKKLQRRLDGESSSMGSSASFTGGYSSQLSSAYGSQAAAHSSHHSPGQHAPERLSGGGVPSPDNSGMTRSGMSSSGMRSSAISVADEASSNALDKITHALAEIVGPMAKVFVKEEVRKICPAEPFSMRHVRQLMTELEQQHITEPEDLQVFRDRFHK